MPIVFQYAVKVVLGRSGGEVVAPGEYWTAINVHNPYHYTFARFIKKIVVARPFEEQGEVFGPFDGRLEPGHALEIDRMDVDRHLEELGVRFEFLKGYVVIECETELNVVAVYTASGREEMLQVFHTERVAPRVLEVREFGE